MSSTVNNAAARGWKKNVTMTSNEPSVTSQCLFRAATVHTTKVLKSSLDVSGQDLVEWCNSLATSVIE